MTDDRKYHEWVVKGCRVEARNGQGDIVATGTVRAYSSAPQVLIMRDDGKRTWWRADMTHEAAERGQTIPKEAP